LKYIFFEKSSGARSPIREDKGLSGQRFPDSGHINTRQPKLIAGLHGDVLHYCTKRRVGEAKKAAFTRR
jgi:hypothetical protein